MATDNELAWAAGFIDGEGCLTITKTDRFGRPSYSAWVIVVNTHKETVERFLELFGCGSIHSQLRDKPFHKRAYSWRCSNHCAEKVTRLVYPYLVTKRSDADVILAYMSLKHEAHNQYGDYAIIQEQREQLYQKLASGRAGGRGRKPKAQK